ncbi:MAG: hypothetical protein JWR52_3890 [Marmoricola sp.]|nr:hypothetical protein [Marmoricola sp.]
MGTNSAFISTTGILRPGAKIMVRGKALEVTARERSLGRCLQALLVSALLMTSAGAAVAQAQPSWPLVSIPKGVTTTGQVEEMTANGLPIRMRSFTSAATPPQVAELFRQSLGQPLVENTVGAKLVLGRSQGEHYVTVQLAAAGSGTRGVIAVTELSAAINGSASSRNADQRLLAKLPAGFKIVSRTVSVDARNRVEHVVLTNTHSITLNAESVKSMLGADGYIFERETQPTGEYFPRREAASRDARMLFFKNSGGEAVAVVSRDDSGRAGVVLNTTSYLERAK